MSDATIERAAVVDESENVDLEERARARRESIDRTAGWLMPLLTIALGIWLWDRIVVWNDIKPFILPGPMRVAETLIADAGLLWDDLMPTTATTNASSVMDMVCI
ncbi:MAG: hypothetical protein AAGF29_03370, partial [Pseudomonadota bacterium]